MKASFLKKSNTRLAALSAAVALALVAGSAQAQVTQSGERKNMTRLGHTDLQGRPSYQPNVIEYPDGRTILFVGTHNNTPVLAGGCPNGTLPNPLNGGACEINGTMIIDVTDPNESGREVSHSGARRRPVADGAHVPGFRSLWGSDEHQGLPAAQRPGRRLVGLSGLGCHRCRGSGGLATGARIVDHRPALDPQAMVGMQDRPHVRAGQQEHQFDRRAVAPVAGDAGLGLEESDRTPSLRPHLRSAGRRADGNGAGSQFFARRDLRVRASQCGRWPGTRCDAPGRLHHRQSHLRGMGRGRRRCDDHHRPQEIAAR